MTALAVLNGTVGMELQSRLAKEVAFETVKEKVRHELDLWVDDADFIELFEFAINLGATKNTFVGCLCEWASKFADEATAASLVGFRRSKQAANLGASTQANADQTGAAERANQLVLPEPREYLGEASFR